MPSIADLFITVSSDVGGAITGLTAVETKLNGTTSNMASATAVALPLAAAAAGVGAAFLGAIDEASTFEKQMSGIKAVMAPDEVLVYGDALEDLAMTLGKETVFSAQQAAGAIEELVKAGVPIETIMDGGARAATSLAAATGFDLARSAEFAGIALNTFHMDSAQLTQTVDTLAGVVNASAADMNGLQFAFSAVGPVAAGLGLSFDDTAIALGLFADNGLRGSDAGTSLKTMLLNLQPTTESQVNAFERLNLFTVDTDEGMRLLTNTLMGTEAGQKALAKAQSDGVVSFEELFKAAKALDPAMVDGAKNSTEYARSMGITSNAFFDAEGNAKPLSEIFEILKDNTSDLTREEKLLQLELAFGADAVRAATIAATEGAEGFNQLAENVGKISAADAAKTRLDNLKGSLEQLGGSFETIQITVGNMFLPVLKSLTDMLTGVLNAFLSLDPSIQGVIVAIVGAVGIVAGLTAAFVILGPLLGAMAAGFGVLAAATAPFLLPLLAIGAAVAALYLAWQTNFGGIQEVTAEVWAAIQPALVNIQNFVTGFASNLGAVFALLSSGDFQGGIFGLDEDSGFVVFLIAARDAVLQLMAALEPLVAQALAQLPGLIRGIGDMFNWLSGILQASSGFWEVLWQVASVNLQAVVRVVVLFIDTIRAIFEGDWGRVLSNMVETFKTIAGALLTNIGIWLQAIADLLGVGDIWEGFVSDVWALGTRVGEALGNLFSYIGSAFSGLPQILAGLGDFFGPIITQAWEIGTRLGEALASFLSYIGNALSGLPDMIGGLGDFFGPLITAAWEIGTRLGEAFANFLGYIGSALSNIPDMIAGLGDFFGPLVNAAWEVGTRLGEAFGNFLGFIGQALSNIPNLIEGLGDLWGPFINGAWELGTRIGEAIMNVIGFIGQVFGAIPAMLEGMGDFFGPIINAAINLVTRLAEVLAPVAQVVQDIFNSVPEWFMNLFGGGTGGGQPGGGGGTLPSPGVGAPLVSVGTLIISSEAEAQAFLDMIAEAILASSRRVSPPVTGTNPALP